VLAWVSGTQAISLTEGPANGPGQNPLGHPSFAFLKDYALAPPEAQSKPVMNF
jgi:hypothetical protein